MNVRKESCQGHVLAQALAPGLVAARTLATLLTAEQLQTGSLYPDQAELRAVSREIAVAVIREARRQSLGKEIPDDAVEEMVDEAMWFPEYVDYV